MVKNPLLEKLRSLVTDEENAQIQESFDLADRIWFLLKKNNITQRELAKRLGKKESEVSKWLSGTHNFTTATLSKISQAIGERVYVIPNIAEEEDRKLTQHHLSALITVYIPKTGSLDANYIRLEQSENHLTNEVFPLEKHSDQDPFVFAGNISKKSFSKIEKSLLN